jgi:hypothetical protein
VRADSPNLEAFLAAPSEDVAAVAPKTIIFAPGGTRRRAALAGISPQSEAYAHWSRRQMIDCCARWFEHGVEHLFMNVLRPAQLAEIGYYRSRVLNWLDWGLAGDDALADYARNGWRVRLLGAEPIPELRDAARRLLAASSAASGPTLWFFVVPTPDAPLLRLLSAIQQLPEPSLEAIFRTLYGEPIPLATMFVGFGKPLLAPDLLPPLLAGELQCYWHQRPGYDLDAQTLRQIIYDYAYLRSTWVPDKSARYEEILAQRTVWEQPVVLGVGRRVGSFWYPSQPDEQQVAVEKV